MANISQGSTENVVSGEGYSPWTFDSNIVYPDSTTLRVGVGTTSIPISSLVAAAAVLHIGSTSSAASSLILQDNEQKFEVLNNGYLGFHCDDSEKMRLTSAGVVGIGTDSPSGAKLHIKDTTNPQLLLEDGTDSFYLTAGAISDSGFTEARTDAQNLVFYSTHASGGVHLGNATGVRKVKYTNSDSSFTMFAALKTEYRNVTTAAHTITSTDGRFIHLCDSSAGGANEAITVNLPAASGNNYRQLIVKDSGGDAAANNITIDPDGAETIDGAATLVINENYGAAHFICDGSNWFIL